MSLETAADWWETVEQYWDALVRIVGDQMDLLHPAYKHPGTETSEPTGRNIADELEWLKEHKDARLARYFQAAWGLSSDSYAYNVPAWGIFCDLCSEGWVLLDNPDI